MSFIQEPSKWNSVFRPVVYQYTYYDGIFTTVTNVGGFARFDLVFTTLISGVRRIYIASGTYAGWHTITATTATTVTTDTVYTATAAGTFKQIEDVQFEIYVGYPSGAYAVNNPERLIATIQPAPDLSAVLQFDISEYLKAAWANDGYSPMIAPPANGVDENMSTPFRVKDLGYGKATGTTYYAAYATIPSADLNGMDVTGIYMSLDEPVVFSCGCTILSQILDTVIYNNIYCGGVLDTEETKYFQDYDVFEFMDGETFIFN